MSKVQPARIKEAKERDLIQVQSITSDNEYILFKLKAQFTFNVKEVKLIDYLVQQGYKGNNRGQVLKHLIDERLEEIFSKK